MVNNYHIMVIIKLLTPSFSSNMLTLCDKDKIISKSSRKDSMIHHLHGADPTLVSVVTNHPPPRPHGDEAL